jgi:hypothetical protein
MLQAFNSHKRITGQSISREMVNREKRSRKEREGKTSTKSIIKHMTMIIIPVNTEFTRENI